MRKRFLDNITILSVKYEPLKAQVIGCKSDRHRILLVLYNVLGKLMGEIKSKTQQYASEEAQKANIG